MNFLMEKIGNDKRLLNDYSEVVISNVRMAILDKLGTILWANERFAKLSSFTKEELIGQPITVLECMETKVFTEIFKSIATFEKWSGEIQTKAPDGSYFWIKTTILPVKRKHKGKIVETFLVLNTNITPTKNALEERNEAVEGRLQSEARYRALVETQPDLVSLCAADGTRIFVNAAYCNFFGKKAQQLIGTNIRETPFKGLPNHVVENALNLDQSTPEVSGIYEVENANRERRWISFCVKGIFNTAGHLSELLTIGRNVSDLKNAEIRKTHYIDAIERIAHMTSHNVRAPIATMLGLVELMRINGIHTDQWNMVMESFKKCIVDLDTYTKELGAYIQQRQT
jgi:PAS domain S-box-containing protein